MIKCIYCLCDKSKDSFTKREHVIPQSFGLFKDNFTLIDTVCDECNHFFGNTLELPLARDSYEGILRFSNEIKKPEDYKSMGKHGRIRTNVADGPLKGAISYREFSKEKNEILMMLAPNQIGFKCEVSNEKIFYLIDEIPTKDELIQLGVNLNHPESIFLLECEPELATNALKQRGIEFKVEKEVSEKNDSTNGLFKIHGSIDQTLCRAVAKIAFNYYIYLMGNDVAFLNEYDEVRNFIRYGELSEDQIVSLEILDEPILGDEPITGYRASAHIVTVENIAQLLFSRVSLNNQFTYVVYLSKQFSLQNDFNEVGHLFDPFGKVIFPLSHGELGDM